MSPHTTARMVHDLAELMEPEPMENSRDPYPGEIDRVMLEGHVDALKDELAAEREAHKSALNRNAELRALLEEARGIMDRYRDCRRFGVGMLQGTRIHLDDEVRSFLTKTGGCQFKDFENF